MPRPALEVADVFRQHGPAWRQANAGHVSLEQLKVMSAIESCRTAALGGHVMRCEDCAHTLISYNSCLMGKFRNGELTTGFIELSVNCGDFALHYGLPPSDLLSAPWIKGCFAQTRWSIDLDLIKNSRRPLWRMQIQRLQDFLHRIRGDAFRMRCVVKRTISRFADLGRQPL